jgi:hypothetical protein
VLLPLRTPPESAGAFAHPSFAPPDLAGTVACESARSPPDLAGGTAGTSGLISPPKYPFALKLLKFWKLEKTWCNYFSLILHLLIILFTYIHHLFFIIIYLFIIYLFIIYSSFNHHIIIII